MASMQRREQAKFWHDNTLGQLELLRATYITHTFAHHTHESYVIAVIQQGGESFRYRHNRYDAWAGHIVVLNPGEVHTGEAIDEHGWTYRVLYPEVDILRQAAWQATECDRHPPFFSQVLINDPLLRQRLLYLHQVLENPDSSPLERESWLMWAMVTLVTRYADGPCILRPAQAERTAIVQARAYLNDHMCDNISLDDLAAHVNLSPYHLLRIFKQDVGLPPHAYLLQRRIDCARQLLRAGFSIADVAAHTGFVDQSHFTRRFKKVIGVTPAQYRNNLQDGGPLLR
ncbi:MAG: AraC family transcriptional regulator [Okeania sp. SIO3B3]|nr:AraC family transcriptional regulator [Okeania sp. SIO3B3]